MLHEAAVLVMAEQMLVEVLGRIRPQDRELVLPALHGRSAQPVRLAAAVEQHLQDEALLPALLSGGPPQSSGPVPERPSGPVPEQSSGPVPERPSGPVREQSSGPVPEVAPAAQAVCAAAAAVEDGDKVLPGPQGELTARELLLRATVERSLLAHYVAAHLGSTACPLPEELARPLWELTAPDAERWRALGHFREPMPLPPHVSWRDRFLLTAGHQPHPVAH